MAAPVETLVKLWKPADQFTRPNDTNQYAVGDLVANNTSAGSVVPLKFNMLAAPPSSQTTIQAGVYIPAARLHFDKASVTSASFRLHLYTALPTFTSSGDNGVYGTVVATGNDNWMMDLDVTLTALHADGASGIAVPTEGFAEPQLVTGLIPGAPWIIYGLLEARDTYTPSAQETIKARLLCEVNY